VEAPQSSSHNANSQAAWREHAEAKSGRRPARACVDVRLTLTITVFVATREWIPGALSGSTYADVERARAGIGRRGRPQG
jgi:hypothetical protein